MKTIYSCAAIALCLTPVLSFGEGNLPSDPLTPGPGPTQPTLPVHPVQPIVRPIVPPPVRPGIPPVTISSATPNGGPDGVEFQPHSIDIRSRNCNSIILKGTRRFKGVAFVLPRVFVGVQKNKNQVKDMFEVISENGGFTIRLGLYFPFRDEAVRLRKDDGDYTQNQCDYDSIIDTLNADAKSEEDKVKSLASLPITRIRAQLQGLDFEAVKGSPGTDLLHYHGLNHILEFKVDDKKQLDQVLARIEGSIGMAVETSIDFAAQALNGYIDFNLNFESLAKNIETTFGAGGTAGVIVGELDLRNQVQNFISNSATDIYMEEGNNQRVNALIDNLINRLAAQNPDMLAPDAALPRPPNPPVIGGPAPLPVEPPQFKFKLGLLVQKIKEEKDISLLFTNVTQAVSRTYFTSTILKGSYDDPNLRTLDLASDEVQPIVLTRSLGQGCRVTLFPIKKIIEDIDYSLYETEFLSNSKMRDLARLFNVNYRSNFPTLLQDPSISIEDVETQLGKLAVYYHGSSFESVDQYTIWGQKTLLPTYQEVQSDGAVHMSIKDLSSIPVGIRFPDLGSRIYTIENLLGQKNSWESERTSKWVDQTTGSISFQIGQAVGRIQLINLEEFETSEDALYTNRYFQQTRTKTPAKKKRKLFAGLFNSRKTAPLAISSSDPNIVQTIYSKQDKKAVLPLRRSVISVRMIIEDEVDGARELGDSGTKAYKEFMRYKTENSPIGDLPSPIVPITNQQP